MELKKNPKLVVGSNSSLYFALGLVVMLAIINLTLNHKTYATEDSISEVMFVEQEIEDEIPITEQIVVPPPPPQQEAAPEIITIVEDIDEIEETVIQSTEISQEEGIEESQVEITEVEVEELEEDVSVPFSVVEKVPIFPGCNQTDNEALKQCFQAKMQEHLLKHFKYPERAIESGNTGKVYVWFEINREGLVDNIKTRGPYKILEQEANRIISLLPKMVPAKQRGRSVKVPYSIPINFRLEN